ncbi:hypothetical protein GSU75_00154 [Pseudomonas savastanoi pv. phaseolicola]|nr:hypothetical protein [Pseudomonas savastanoi pv. phaseolicola]
MGQLILKSFSNMQMAAHVPLKFIMTFIVTGS